MIFLLVLQKKKNKKCGRTGYCRFKQEKETNLSPFEYGMFIQSHKKGGKRNDRV